MGDFRKLLKEIRTLSEETTSGDIATVPSVIGSKPIRRIEKGKKCSKHKRFNCIECNPDYKE